jgi:hypothetical protein
MPQRIRILKGNYNKIRIADSTFPLLKPIETTYGKSKATIDASTLLGSEYKVLSVDVEDYRILE